MQKPYVWRSKAQLPADDDEDHGGEPYGEPFANGDPVTFQDLVQQACADSCERVQACRAIRNLYCS